MPVALRTHRFTADEYQRMGQVGILSEDDRVELIDGEILTMTPIGPRHSAAVDRASQAFFGVVGGRAIVRVQGPTRLNLYTEPEPDILLLRPRADFYASGHPGPSDVLLIVEIADSSIGYDRDMKAYIYAQSGIHEYWLVDLNDHALLRHAVPEGGAYREVERVTPEARIAPLLLPECVVDLTELIVP